MSYFNTSMIVFDYDVCPTLILAVILREVLRFAVGVYICVHNRHLYMSVVESLLYFVLILSKRGMCLLNCKRIKQDGCL